MFLYESDRGRTLYLVGCTISQFLYELGIESLNTTCPGYPARSQSLEELFYIFLAIFIVVQFRAAIEGSPLRLILKKSHGVYILHGISGGRVRRRGSFVLFYSHWIRLW